MCSREARRRNANASLTILSVYETDALQTFVFSEKISFENLYSILGFTSLKASSIDHKKHSLEEI